MQIPNGEEHSSVDEIVFGHFGSCKLVIQFRKSQLIFTLPLPGILVFRVGDEIEDIRTQTFDCGAWSPAVVDRSQGLFSILVHVGMT
jgi:hypothetical protein